ncbi:MAG TPA: tetratricopeptide repeat protein [Phycisphaerae bacterium]|nr:tetratricopeptide repeat protein [Phycisphaerae bacterium]HNU46625.1 tetratricopeptide repeat protein [Phycisphaerae bacterium]
MSTATIARHGCLLFFLGIGYAAAGPGEPTAVPSRVLDIEYQVNREAEPLDAVELWYTLDDGASWHLYGVDEDRQSPFTFTAPAEGKHGLFLVLTNATGASTETPGADTRPHQWVYVDSTPPVVQVLPPKLTYATGWAVMQLRWTAIDANLGTRPVDLAYRPLPDQRWCSIGDEALANTGRYDWRVPDGLSGALVVRVTVTDLGGHRVSAISEAVEVASLNAAAAQVKGGADAAGQAGTAAEAARARAAQLYAEGKTLGERGDDREAIRRLREAIRLDPQHTDALDALGLILFRVGDTDGALDAYKLVLRQNPDRRSALQGAARVETVRHDYPSATARLRQILGQNPNDVEVWMHLGDLALLQGDELTAREHYLRALTLDPSATRVIADTRKRFELLDEVSRTYRRPGTP